MKPRAPMEFAPRPEFYPLPAEDLALVERLVARAAHLCATCAHLDIAHPINLRQTCHCAKLLGWRAPWHGADCPKWELRA